MFPMQSFKSMVSVMLHKWMNVEEAVTLDIDDSRVKDVCSEV